MNLAIPSESGTDTDTKINISASAIPAQAQIEHRRALVPYITAWSTEQVEPSEIVIRRTGIGYADETITDRDQHGVLWQRRPSLPEHGRPVLGQVHLLRQRRAMRRLLCSVCAGPPDHNDQGILWLLRDHRQDWPGWPNGMGVVEPPVCLSCARHSVRACPALRKGWVTVRVGHSTVAGVYGIQYQAAYPWPVAVDDVTVTFDDPVIRWVCAGQLVREIDRCVIVELGSLEGPIQ